MNIKKIRTLVILTLLCITTLLSACATNGTPVHEDLSPFVSRVKPEVEALLLNVRALEEIYQLLHASAQGYAFFGDDQQLDYIQKTALFVQDALQEAHHQWEFFSIIDDIKEQARRDYFTLRFKGLTEASADLQFDISLVELYTPFITNAVASNDTENAVETMRAIQRNYKELLSLIEPLVNAPATKAELLRATERPRRAS